MSEKKPCPFCGSRDTVLRKQPLESQAYAVCCNKCFAQGPVEYVDTHNQRLQAVLSWNERQQEIESRNESFIDSIDPSLLIFSLGMEDALI